MDEYLCLIKPRYLAAALVFQALSTIGDYPEDAPDYDRVARDHLFAALERLAPGLGNPDALGLPRRRAPLSEPEPEPAEPPAWVAEVLEL